MDLAAKEPRAFHLPKPLKCKVGEERELQADLPGPGLVEAALTSIRGPHLHVHQVRLLIQSGHRPGEGRRQKLSDRRTAEGTGEALRAITGNAIFLKRPCPVPSGPTKRGHRWVLPLPLVAATCHGHNTSPRVLSCRDLVTQKTSKSTEFKVILV